MAVFAVFRHPENTALTYMLRSLINISKNDSFRLRPYHAEYTGSRPITEVKQRRARLVLGWETAWEYRVS